MNICITDNDSTLMKEEILDEVARYAGVQSEIQKITDAQMNGDLHITFEESLRKRVEILCAAEKKITNSNLKEIAQNSMHFSDGVEKCVQEIIQICGTLKQQFFIFSGGFYEIISIKIDELHISEEEKNILKSQTFANHFQYNNQQEIIGVDWGKSQMWEEHAKGKMTQKLIDDGIISDNSTIIGVGDGSNDFGIVPKGHGMFVAFTGSVKRKNTIAKANGVTAKNFYEVLEFLR